ncbi:MAG: hypothetical protein R3F60_33515 [bacterium]
MRPLPAAVACLLTLLAGGLAACDAPCADCADDLTDGGGGGGGPCTQDRQGCAASSGLKESAVCADGPALTVELGTGREAFVSLAEGESPPIEYGPQGGSHLFGSVRIGGAQLDRYHSLELRFALENAPCAEEDEYCYPGRETRTALIEAPFAFGADQAIEEPGFVVFADSFQAPGTFSVEVIDPCGRRAEASHHIE